MTRKPMKSDLDLSLIKRMLFENFFSRVFGSSTIQPGVVRIAKDISLANKYPRTRTLSRKLHNKKVSEETLLRSSIECRPENYSNQSNGSLALGF